MAEAIITAKVKEMAKEMSLRTCEADLTTLFLEDADSPILREVAFSMWNQINKLHEEGVVQLREDYYDIDEFIQSIKKAGLRTGLPDEIQSSNENLLKVLGAGEATLYEKEEPASALLRRVTARHGSMRRDKEYGESPPSMWPEPVPFKPMSLDQIVELWPRRHGGEPHFHVPEIEFHLEKAGDTVYMELTAPKDETGNHVCGWPLVVTGILKPTLKVCIIDSYVVISRLEALVKHPIEWEMVDSPAIRQGATTCVSRFHLQPTQWHYGYKAPAE